MKRAGKATRLLCPYAAQPTGIDISEALGYDGYLGSNNQGSD